MKADLRPAAANGAVTREGLLALAEGDAEFLRDLVETFAADARERLAELRQAVAPPAQRSGARPRISRCTSRNIALSGASATARSIRSGGEQAWPSPFSASQRALT